MASDSELYTSASSYALLTPQCQRTPAPLTKRAPLGGDYETRTSERPGRCPLGKPTGSPGKLERGAFPQYWLFPANPRCRAVNRRAESSLSDNLAPQTGLEPIAFWLTLLSHISGFWASERETAEEGSGANCEEHRCGRTGTVRLSAPRNHGNWASRAAIALRVVP